MGLDNPVHMLLIVVLLLLLFGAKRLPEIGRSLGTGMREFKQSVTGEGANHGQDAQAPADVARRELCRRRRRHRLRNSRRRYRCPHRLLTRTPRTPLLSASRRSSEQR